MVHDLAPLCSPAPLRLHANSHLDPLHLFVAQLAVVVLPRPDVCGPFGINPNRPGLLGFVYQSITVFSFNWISWGNCKSEDLKAQVRRMAGSLGSLDEVAWE